MAPRAKSPSHCRWAPTQFSEVQAPYGFVHTDHTYTVVLDWDNQYNDLVLAKAVTDHTQDGDVIYDYSIINVGNASAEQMEKQILVFENAPCAAGR